MATYVFSDVHGHLATLERVLDRVSLTEDDAVYCLGDMIDRGPDPVGVLKLVRSLPNVQVLQGNHEDLMISYLSSPDDGLAAANWSINGGMMTLSGLHDIDEDEALDLIKWVASLGRSAQVEVSGRRYVMAHAGIRPRKAPHEGEWDEKAIGELLASQDPDDLVWIREEFWSVPTGLVNEKGEGPIVIAGHTPTPYLEGMTELMDRPPYGDDGFAQMVRVGACDETGGVADRWDIDSGAAGGAGFGRVTFVRLDDGEEISETIREGE
ncbi:MAG: metallophosphoesterase family protein [Tractidigestivibacter sp.]|jgi:serine/threonine protein phosphatase 1|uniref:metallophosphoesterase family protein n=1 Tax=Tractidigestivibacter sp. TaxID=2847320 RepID=UPI003D91BB3D